jgi:hypothetical protein
MDHLPELLRNIVGTLASNLIWALLVTAAAALVPLLRGLVWWQVLLFSVIVIAWAITTYLYKRLKATSSAEVNGLKDQIEQIRKTSKETIEGWIAQFDNEKHKVLELEQKHRKELAGLELRDPEAKIEAIRTYSILSVRDQKENLFLKAKLSDAEAKVESLVKQVEECNAKLLDTAPLIVPTRYFPVTDNNGRSAFTLVNDGKTPAYGVRVALTFFDSWGFSFPEIARIDAAKDVRVDILVSGQNVTRDLAWALGLWQNSHTKVTATGHTVDAQPLRIMILYRSASEDDCYGSLCEIRKDPYTERSEGVSIRFIKRVRVSKADYAATEVKADQAVPNILNGPTLT